MGKHEGVIRRAIVLDCASPLACRFVRLDLAGRSGRGNHQLRKLFSKAPKPLGNNLSRVAIF
jgi:hypothetical protein